MNTADTTCPRCGYDLRGAVESWSDRCPLDGTCNECGLEFAWASVLNPGIRIHRWHIEHASGRRIPIAALLTLLRMLAPWRFWRLLRMEHPPKPRRIAMLFILVLPLVYLNLCASIGVSRGLYAWRGSKLQQGWIAGRNTLADPRKTMTLTGHAMLHSLKRARGSSTLLSRANQLSLPSTLMLLAVPLCPVTFLMLPVTLQRCRVQRWHLLRIAAYSALVIPVLSLPLLAITGHHRSWVGDYSWLPAIIGSVQWVWLIVWWGFASSRYLRLPRAWLVAAVLVVLSLLLSAALLFLLDLVLVLAT